MPNPIHLPKAAARITPFGILDQDEPDFGIRSPVRISCCHLGVFTSENFLYEDAAIREFSGATVGFAVPGDAQVRCIWSPFGSST